MTIVAKIAETKGFGQAGALGLGAGANLRTPCGDRRVDNLRPGDLVVTRDNGLQPVRYVWSQTFSAAEVAADPSLAPIHFKSRAVGPMMPQRGVTLGGAHRVLVPGWKLENVDDCTNCLMAARDLVGAHDESYSDRIHGDVTYYHVLFDRHQVFTANGLPVESFLPSPVAMSAMGHEATDRITEIFPELLRSPSSYPPAEYPTPDQAMFLADAA
ncbi:MAG: Hint domain-containing protein [Rhodobacteraceae bacterium]|nr:Hint domain-containing protein [Paracoccaceae bacterium]